MELPQLMLAPESTLKTLSLHTAIGYVLRAGGYYFTLVLVLSSVLVADLRTPASHLALSFATDITSRELMLMTLAVGRVKDNAEGLRYMLGDGVSRGIAADIYKLHSEGVVSFDGMIDGSEWS
eukprot:572942-Pleurochrysis_carterae.AAC.3